MIESIENINLHIQFNKKIIQKLKSYDLTADNIGSSLFILFALHEGRYDLLDTLDDNNRERRAIILYRQLQRRELLVPTVSTEKYNFKLTEKAMSVIDYIKGEFQDTKVSINAESTESFVKIERVEGWINEYIAIFPKGYRDHPSVVATRMEEFMKSYPEYNKDIILRAAIEYIRKQEDSETGHEYTRRSVYFISKYSGKDKVSDLATWCKYVEDEGTDDSKFKTSIMDTI